VSAQEEAMKNEDLNGVATSEVERQRALLCAYLLGELESAAERSEIEAALAASAELRAERARIEATIGLVSGALAQGEPKELSPESVARLDGARAGRSVRPWHARPWLRIAAAAALLLGGSLVLMQSTTEKRLIVALVEEREEASEVDRLAQPAAGEVELQRRLKSNSQEAASGDLTGRAFDVVDAQSDGASGRPEGFLGGLVAGGAAEPAPGEWSVAKSTPAPSAAPATKARALTGGGKKQELVLGLKELGYFAEGEANTPEVESSDHNEVASTREQLARPVLRDSEDADAGRSEPVDELSHRLKDIALLCRRMPNESPRDMFFRYWGDNPFELAAVDRLSTFSADVDTASYTLARRYLTEGQLPTKAQVRTEEFLNYFKGDVEAPSEGTFRIQMELAPSLFGDSSDTWMLRVALRGREVTKQARDPLALTFVIDVSGSMEEEARLELVKHALRMLVSQLDTQDTISIVKFSSDASLVLPATSVRHRDLIESALQPLAPEGGTNTEAGLRMGYAQASAALTQGAQNRVVLLTDGVANIGITDPNALVAMVESSRRQGILLNTVGVGMDNHNDHLLEQLADKGDGLCNYVDDEREVRRALVDNFTGAFQSIARDAKLQVEFDPSQVESYRLLGYENRAIADADFRNAKVDAAEIGAGHQVVALYEVVRKRSTQADGPLAVARVRWKAPYRSGVADAASNESESELETRLSARDAVGGYGQASAGYRRSVLVGQFAEFLRRSVHARSDSVDRLLVEAERLDAELRDPDFSEFVTLVKRSRELVLAELQRRDWIDDCGDALKHHEFLRARCRELEERGAESAAGETKTDFGSEFERLAGGTDESAQAALRELTVELQAENIHLQRRLSELSDALARQAADSGRR
jgi:Ca-activated chloride channel family protein